MSQHNKHKTAHNPKFPRHQATSGLGASLTRVSTISVIVEIVQNTSQREGAPTSKGNTAAVVDSLQWEEVYNGVENTCMIGGGSTQAHAAKGAVAKVKADTEYIVRCCLCDHLGCGDWAIAPHPVRTLPDPQPLAPINVRIVTTPQQGPATPTLEWTPNPQGPRPSSFVIQSRRISRNHNPNQQLETQPTEGRWAQAGITKTSQQQEPPTSMDITPEMVNSGGSGVEFRVAALNGPSAPSPWSNVALFKCEPPGDLHITMFPTLDWSPPSPTTQPPQWYVVQRKPHNAPPESEWQEVCRGTQTSCDVTAVGSPPIRRGDNSEYDFRVGSLCAGVVMSTTWKWLQNITGAFTWDPSSCYQTNLSDNNHIATGVSGNNSTTVWTTQCVTTGSVAVARITLIKRDTTCSTPFIGVVGPAITSNQPTPPSGYIYSREGFWGFNLGNRTTWHNGKQQPIGDSRNGCDNTPDGTVITVTVDMTHPGGGTMSVRVGDCDRGVVCCSGLPSPLRFAFSACCGHVIKIE
ncbi:hypothetical protein Pelo_18761 [Pelomyxa schiedti]|nr:hypothetical protein Pelo_18761 [Pelomyxa schiedti]